MLFAIRENLFKAAHLLETARLAAVRLQKEVLR
jgi:hypothetical protein